MEIPEQNTINEKSLEILPVTSSRMLLSKSDTSNVKEVNESLNHF